MRSIWRTGLQNSGFMLAPKARQNPPDSPITHLEARLLEEPINYSSLEFRTPDYGYSVQARQRDTEKHTILQETGRHGIYRHSSSCDQVSRQGE